MKCILSCLIVLTIVFSCSPKNTSVIKESNQNKEKDLDQIKKEFVFKSNDFGDFYNKFISDTVFQVTKVKFPLKGNYSDYDENIEWTKEKWSSIKWDFREEMNKSDDSISIEQNLDKFFFGLYCRDCGFSFEMEFEKIENEWFLVYRQENNF